MRVWRVRFVRSDGTIEGGVWYSSYAFAAKEALDGLEWYGVYDDAFVELDEV
jgi:hypothetical protein